jgi:hypothetical protein
MGLKSWSLGFCGKNNILTSQELNSDFSFQSVAYWLNCSNSMQLRLIIEFLRFYKASSEFIEGYGSEAMWWSTWSIDEQTVVSLSQCRNSQHWKCSHSHAFTTSYVYVIYCNIRSVIRYRNVYFTVLIIPFHLLLCRSVVHEIGIHCIFQ